jgi:secretion/DNA translocation related CpaE-like protein
VLDLTTGPGRLADLLGELADSGRPPGVVVGVVGGSGGVGASVLTVALAAVATTSGADAVAVDLAPRGAGLAVVAGLEEAHGPDWDTLSSGQGRLNSTALRESLQPRSASAPAVLGWGPGSRRRAPGPAVVAEVVAAARRGHDWVALDDPTADGWSACDAMLLVVAGSVHGIRAAGRTAELLPAGVPVGLAVRSPRRDGWAAEVPRALSLPSWTVVTDQRGLDEHLSAGLGPVRRPRSPLARSARDVLAAVGGLR